MLDEGAKSRRDRDSWIVVAVLFVLLVVSNAWWAYSLLDQGVTLSYREQELIENEEAVEQLLAVVRDVGMGAERERVLSALRAHWPFDPFEKDGYVIAGRLALRFDGQNRLVEVLGPSN